MIRVVFLFVILSQSIGSEHAHEIPANDIDTYDKAGPYERAKGADSQYSPALKARIARSRAWLWSHWIEHHKGLLMETYFSIEGDQSTFFYFVEPDKGGRWRIGVKIERISHYAKYDDPDCRFLKEEQFTSYNVVRVDQDFDAGGNEILIPADSKRQPNEYKIRMKLEEAGNFIYY